MGLIAAVILLLALAILPAHPMLLVLVLILLGTQAWFWE